MIFGHPEVKKLVAVKAAVIELVPNCGGGGQSGEPSLQRAELALLHIQGALCMSAPRQGAGQPLYINWYCGGPWGSWAFLGDPEG